MIERYLTDCFNTLSAIVLVVSILLIQSLLRAEAKTFVSTRDWLICVHTVIFLAVIVCAAINCTYRVKYVSAEM